MKIVLKEATSGEHIKKNMKYFYVYDKENPFDLDGFDDSERKAFVIIGSVREYTSEKILDMDIADWIWYSGGNAKAPNYKNKGYGKALFAHLMDEVLPTKEDASLWKITIGHSLDDATSFYEHHFSKERGR